MVRGSILCSTGVTCFQVGERDAQMNRDVWNQHTAEGLRSGNGCVAVGLRSVGVTILLGDGHEACLLVALIVVMSLSR